MKNSGLTKLAIISLAFSCLMIFRSDFSFANVGSIRSLKGRVIYSDNKSPVTGGTIRVMMTSTANSAAKEVESIQISDKGEFMIKNYLTGNLTDGIHIMCYPNEIDNSEGGFEPETLDFTTATSNHDANYAIIIEVNRIGKSSGDLYNTDESNNLILRQNYPNPFNPTTSIKFDLPDASRVSLKVYDMKGDNVATLVDNENLSKGVNQINFNGGSLPSGMYVYRLKAGEYSENRKMILIK